MVTRRQFLKQIGQAAAAGTAFAAGAARIKEPCDRTMVRKDNHPLSSYFFNFEKCKSCRMPKCASTVTIEAQPISLQQLCEMLEKNKAAIAEIIQTGKLNGRKMFYQVDHKMGPSRIPLSPIS